MYKVLQECCTFLSIELERLNRQWPVKVERPLKKWWEHPPAINQYLQGQQDDIIHFFYLKQNQIGMITSFGIFFQFLYTYSHFILKPCEGVWGRRHLPGVEHSCCYSISLGSTPPGPPTAGDTTLLSSSSAERSADCTQQGPLVHSLSGEALDRDSGSNWAV